MNELLEEEPVDIWPETTVYDVLYNLNNNKKYKFEVPDQEVFEETEYSFTIKHNLGLSDETSPTLAEVQADNTHAFAHELLSSISINDVNQNLQDLFETITYSKQKVNYTIKASKVIGDIVITMSDQVKDVTPPPGPEPDPEPTGDETMFRKDKLVKNYTQESWNQMYNNAAKHADELTKLWNMIYSSKSNKAVLFYNKMYMAVASGKSLEDPDLQAELRAWNAQAAR